MKSPALVEGVLLQGEEEGEEEEEEGLHLY